MYCYKLENDKHFNYIQSIFALILDIKKIVARNIGDNTIRSRKFTQSFQGELITSGDEFVALNNFKLHKV